MSYLRNEIIIKSSISPPTFYYRIIYRIKNYVHVAKYIGNIELINCKTNYKEEFKTQILDIYQELKKIYIPI